MDVETMSPSSDLVRVLLLFRQVGIKYEHERKEDKRLISSDRHFEDGILYHDNPVFIEYEHRVDVDQGCGHASVALFFDDSGKFVGQAGYEC